MIGTGTVEHDGLRWWVIGGMCWSSSEAWLAGTGPGVAPRATERLQFIAIV